MKATVFLKGADQTSEFDGVEKVLLVGADSLNGPGINTSGKKTLVLNQDAVAWFLIENPTA